ncbi:hypothetical protein HDU81_001331, partial [Chytriomyces hyalinus]
LLNMQQESNANSAFENTALQAECNVNPSVQQVKVRPETNVNPTLEQVSQQSEINANLALEQVNLVTEGRKIPYCFETNPPCWVTVRKPTKNKLHSKKQLKPTPDQGPSPAIESPTVVPAVLQRQLTPDTQKITKSPRKGTPRRSLPSSIFQEHPTRAAREDAGIVQMDVFDEYARNPAQLLISRSNGRLAEQQSPTKETTVKEVARSTRQGKGRGKKTKVANAKVGNAAPKRRTKAVVEKAVGSAASSSKSETLLAHDSAISLDNNSSVRRGRSAGLPNAGSLKRGRDSMADGDEVVSKNEKVRSGPSRNVNIVNSQGIKNNGGGVGRVGGNGGESGFGEGGSGSGDGASNGGDAGVKRRRTAEGGHVVTGAGPKLFPSSWSSTGATSATRMAAEAAAAVNSHCAAIGNPGIRLGSLSSTDSSGVVKVEGPGAVNEKLRDLPFELISEELLAELTSCKQRGDAVSWKKS